MPVSERGRLFELSCLGWRLVKWNVWTPALVHTLDIVSNGYGYKYCQEAVLSRGLEEPALMFSGKKEGWWY